MDWSGLHSDDMVRAAFGPDAFTCGLRYARGGHVVEVGLDRDRRVLQGKVAGNAPRPYATIVTQESTSKRRGAPASPYTGRCSCPVGYNCKHAAALVIAARDVVETGHNPGEAGAKAGPADWERKLQGLLRDHSGQAAEDHAPLALQFELARPKIASSYRTRYANTDAPPGMRLRVRPVVRGKSGKWVRTGASWRDLTYGWGRSSFVPSHRDLLRELHIAHQAQASIYYAPYAHDDWLDLATMGPSLWRLLDRATQIGVELVPPKKSDPAIGAPASPATIGLDLTRDRAGGDAVLEAIATVDDASFGATGVELLGTPAHGFFTWGDESALKVDGRGVISGAAINLFRLAEPLDAELRRLIAGHQRLSIPSGDVDHFLHDYYPRLRQLAPIDSGDDSVRFPDIAAPQLALLVTYESIEQLRYRWCFRYQIGNEVRHHPVVGGLEGGGSRDPRAEAGLVEALDLSPHWSSQLFTETAGPRRMVPEARLSGLAAIEFTEELLPQLRDNDDDLIVEVDGVEPDYHHSDSEPLVELSTTESEAGSDWFDLGIEVSVDGESVPFEPLFRALATEQDHLILDSGTYFRLDRPQLAQLRRLILEARNLQDRESDQLRLTRFQADLWAELVELGVVKHQADRWAHSVQALTDLDATEPPPLPDGIDADLRPYQLDGYGRLSFWYDHQLGGILADDMGLGKTLQTIALIARARVQDPDGPPFVVVAPTSVVGNWASELHRFAPGLSVATINESEARRGQVLKDVAQGIDVVITSYTLLRIEYDAYDALAWSGLILDEAQFVKNHQGKTHQCIRRLDTPFKLAITGTPMENNLMELWALLSIVAPGMFPNPQRFNEHYRKPIESGTDPELLRSFRRRIRPFMLRRSKEHVATELPPKQEQILEVDLNPRHAEIYARQLQRERQKVLGLVDDLDKNRFAIFRSLTLLRQLSLDAGLVDEKYRSVRSSKVDALWEHLREVVEEGHRALVFSQFTGFLRTIRERLDAEGVDYCYLDGHTRNRANVIEGFKSGEAPVFLVSLKAGGFGLNLTEADYCFVMDPWWNPAAEAQAVDRTHRIGQGKTVMVYRLVATDTIEEKVMALKARKSALFTSVMDGDTLMSSSMSADDIRELFGA